MGWNALTDEQRTRYEALFFSQGPIEGLLPGEKARELFLLSKLSLQVLSKIWNIVDIPHDNMLDSTEFGNAIHLIQHNLYGDNVPQELPECLSTVECREETRVPHMSTKEYGAYKGLYQSLKKDVKGCITAAVVRDTLITSRVPTADLAHVWNLADANRDGKLDLEEFTIACHLTRFYKKGKKISGAVNVQSILPHKLPKTDLIGKRKKLSLLEKKKHHLMALREQRKLQAKRESRRVELWKQRLKILTSMHHILTESPENQVMTEHNDTLAKDQEHIKQLQAVADRLKKEDERVRKATTKVIIEEQKLSKEVKTLEEEAEKLRKRRQRNSLIKDLDPFHQLYEERKEEKLSGVATSAKKEEYKIEIPPGQDPFDLDKINNPPLSGEELFSLNNNNKQQNSGIENQPGLENIFNCSWDSSEFNPKIMELTQGFDDNFVDFWTQKTAEANSKASESTTDDFLFGEIVNPGLRELDSEFTFDDQVDAVFKTVSVTAEEDDLWSSVTSSSDVLTSPQQEEFTSLQSQLSSVKEQMKDLNQEGPQILFKDSQSYSKQTENIESPELLLQTSVEGLLNKERRRYKSVEKDDSTESRSHSRNIHGVERRKKRISAEPSQKASQNLQSVHSDNLNSDSLKLEFDFLTEDCNNLKDTKNESSHNTSPNATEEHLIPHNIDSGQSKSSELVFDPFHIKEEQSEHSNLFSLDPFSDNLLQIKQDSVNAQVVVGNSEPQITTDVIKRSGNSTARSERLEKAKTWCAGDQSPVPPPRKKSPKKQTSTAEFQKGTPPIPNRSRSSEKNKSSPVRSPESSVESSPSPRRPPRKGSPSKKKKSVTTEDNLQFSSASGPTSPVSVLIAGKDQYYPEGETSSENSPVAPPRPKRGSKRTKSPVFGGVNSEDHTRLSTEDLTQVLDETNQSDAKHSEKSPIFKNYENVNVVKSSTKESEFSQEIEALFDQVANSSLSEEVAESSTLNENIVSCKGGKDHKTSSVGRTPTSDYCSQSDGSLIDDDMEAAARKQELDRLREFYFGDSSSSKKFSSEPIPSSSGKEDKTQSNIQVSSTEITVGELNSLPKESENLFNTNNNSDTRSETESKRDSGCFLEDAFSSVNFEVDPFQPQPSTAQAQPTKISIDLDTYQSEFVSTLDKRNKNNDPFFTTQLGQVINEKNVKSVFNEGFQCNEKFSSGNSSLINLEHDGVINEPPCNEGNDSDISDSAVNFKAEFDPLVQTNESDSFTSPRDSDITLISYQAKRSCNENLARRQDNFVDFSADKRSSYELSAEKSVLDNFDSLLNDDFSEIKSEPTNDWDINNMTATTTITSVDIPPALPSEPPPPLPTSPPPNLNSLRSALKQDNITASDLWGVSNEPQSNLNNKDNYIMLKEPRVVDAEDNTMPNIKVHTKDVGDQPNNAQIQGNIVMNENSSQVLKSSQDLNDWYNGKDRLNDINITESSNATDTLDTSNKDYSNFGSVTNGKNNYVDNHFSSDFDSEKNSHVDKVLITVTSDAQDNITSQPPGPNSTTVHNIGMDPVTGLRRTNVSDPVEKALKFVQDTEPSFRVKKKVHTPEELDEETYLTGFKSRAQEIQEERQEILDSMKIKKKNFDNWYPNNVDPQTVNNNYYYAIEDHGVDFTKSAESERKYEERKKKLQERVKENSTSGSISPVQVTTSREVSPSRPVNSNMMNSYDYSVTTTTSVPDRNVHNAYQPADIDSTSITEQKHITKQHWEEKFSSPDVKLFPGDVREKPIKVKTIVKSTSYEKRAHDNESAIEREIRLAQEREEELRREKESRLKEAPLSDNKESAKHEKPNMPIHRVPLASPTSPPMKTVTTIHVETKTANPKYSSSKTSEMLSPQSYRELTEVDRDSVPKQESIIEREIREQMQREESVRQEIGKKSKNPNKEAEQSEYERKEKEHERLNAHESVIDREIRLQKERDLEVQRLRALARGEPAQPVSHQAVVSTRSTEPVVEKPVKLAAVNKQSSYSPAPTKSANTTNIVQSSQDTDMSSRGYSLQHHHKEADIAYSDAIAAGHHSGESLIAKELREQREREEELRQHWESLGFSVPENARDPPDTPYNMPEPKQPPPMKNSFSMPGSLSSQSTSQRLLPSYQKDMKHSTSADIRYLNSNTGATKSGRRASTDSASSKSTDHGDTSTQAHKPKVQPYRSDSDEEDGGMYRFVPQTETPVEREIRLAKEREEALRKEKGLPTLTTNSNDSHNEVVLEIRGNYNRPVATSTRKSTSEDDRGTMQRFASSRLQLEIEKEKRREMDLKNVGKINTLSEERVGPSTKYIDIISKEDGPPVVKSPTTHKNFQRSSSSSSKQGIDHPDNGPTVQNGPVPSVYRYPTEPAQKGGQAGAESMIERELREMKEREEELRSQRERALGRPIPVSEQQQQYNQHEVQFRQNGTMDSSVKTNRRKSALAEEWEKKFGATS